MKTKYITLLILILTHSYCFMSCTRVSTPMHSEIVLNDGWQVQSAEKAMTDGQALSGEEVSTEGWYEATVPSTIMGVLTDNGLYPDILEGTNYLQADNTPFKGAWWYRTTFTLPEMGTNEFVKLLFDGVNYRANIWLNGVQLASQDSTFGTFRTYDFDITPYVKQDNTLAVEVFRAEDGEPNIGFVDWNPRPLDESMGIFREVRVVTTGKVDMKNTWVRTDVNTQTLDEADVFISTQLQNLSDKAVKGYLEGKIENIIFKLPITLNAHETKTVELSPSNVPKLHIHNPRLWWCSTMGSPELYNLNLAFTIDYRVSCEEDITFGIRQIETYFTPDGHKGIVLNGKNILIKSAGWTDDIFLRDTPESNELQVNYVKDMNLNSIRFENIWGTSQNIYDLCDQYGLLALVGWSCQWEWESYMGIPDNEFGCIYSDENINLLSQYFHDQVIWLRNHPSVVAWLVGSDKLPHPELEKKYLALASQLDDRPYIGAAKTLVSDISGPTGTKMNGPYEYVGPNYWYIDTLYGGAFGFNTETSPGPSIPVYESIKRMVPPSELWPMGKSWDYHCTTSTTAMNTMETMTKIINEKLGEATTLDSYLKSAHWLNYEATKSMFEAFRVNKKEGTGIVQWMLNSAWPSMYWQLYDYYHIPTPAYYGVKKGNLPCQLIYNYKERAVYGVNETLQAEQDLKAVVQLYSLNSQLIFEADTIFSLGDYDAKRLIDIPVETGNTFLKLALYNEAGEEIADNFYVLSDTEDTYQWEKTDWVGTPLASYSNFKPLRTLPQGNLSVSPVGSSDKRQVVFQLENRGDQIVFFTELLLKDKQGEVVYPVYWEDNYISLMPGEKRRISCRFNTEQLSNTMDHLQVKGWNIMEQSLNLN